MMISVILGGQGLVTSFFQPDPSFLFKYSSPSSLSPKAPALDQYTTVISVQRGSDAETYIREFVAEKEWLGRVIVVSNEDNEHFSAMAASDRGIAYDG
jgi:hypothetical protein